MIFFITKPGSAVATWGWKYAQGSGWEIRFAQGTRDYSETTVGVSRSRYSQVDFSSRKIHPENSSRRLE